MILIEKCKVQIIKKKKKNPLHILLLYILRYVCMDFKEK